MDLKAVHDIANSSKPDWSTFNNGLYMFLGSGAFVWADWYFGFQLGAWIIVRRVMGFLFMALGAAIMAFQYFY